MCEKLDMFAQTFPMMESNSSIEDRDEVNSVRV